jgi:hypothetical protein
VPSFTGASDYLSSPLLTAAGRPRRHFQIGADDERIAGPLAMETPARIGSAIAGCQIQDGV